ncbi:unnamed protein product [Caenorhabditis nigoni]
MTRQDEFEKNFVVFVVVNNFKTGENISLPYYSSRFRTATTPKSHHMHHGLYWEPSRRDEDNFPGEEAFACAYRDVDQFLADRKPELVSDQSRIEVGESKMSGNGTVRVKCGKFDGHVRRVSESFSGCYYNGTVYRINQGWEEPNPGNDRIGNGTLWKSMSCQKSDDGYFENKLVGCSIHKTISFTTTDNSVVTHVSKHSVELNEVNDPNYDGHWKKCVESEPGVVKLEEAAKINDSFCTVDNVVHKGIWDDDVKGVRWWCRFGNVIEKTECKIGKNYYIRVNTEHTLPNGCKFICHPQTNVFQCDEALNMFKIEGKPRKMRKWMPGRG